MNLIERRRMMMAAGGGSGEPDYLRFTALEDNSSVSLNETGNPPTLNLEYRVNGGTWTAYTYGTAISLDTDDYMEMRNADDTIRTQVSLRSYSKRVFAMSGVITATGNVMSLLDKTCESTTVGSHGMRELFYGCTSLIHCDDLKIFTTSGNSLNSMFYGCSELINGPRVMTTVFAAIDFSSMFKGCSNINECHFYGFDASSIDIFNSSSIKSLIIDNVLPDTINNNTFRGMPNDCIIYVPDASVNDYKTAQYWSARKDYIKGISEKP